MSRVLITDGAGFNGPPAPEALLAAGHAVPIVEITVGRGRR